MDDLVPRTLRMAASLDRPVDICYIGKDGISQRRIYVRSVDADKVTAYCTLKRALRVFKTEGILSAQMAEADGG